MNERVPATMRASQPPPPLVSWRALPFVKSEKLPPTSSAKPNGKPYGRACGPASYCDDGTGVTGGGGVSATGGVSSTGAAGSGGGGVASAGGGGGALSATVPGGGPPRGGTVRRLGGRRG